MFKIELEEDVKGALRQAHYMKLKFSKAQGYLGAFSVYETTIRKKFRLLPA